MIRTLKRFNWLFPLLILFSLVLGTFGFYQYSILHGQPPDWFSAFYLSLQLFVLNSGGVPGPIPITLEIARFFAPALTAGGIFLALWEPFHENYLLFKLRFWKGHIVVCGLSKKAELLILDFLKAGGDPPQIVIIEPNADHPELHFFRRKGILILQGDATAEDVLMKANILKAKYLLALTQDETTNILIARRATHIFNQHPQQIPEGQVLQAIIHIDDFYTMNVFKEFHEKVVPEMATSIGSSTKMDYYAFSIYQMAAAFMVDQYSPDQYVSLRRDEDPAAHVLILGDNLAAQYLILEAARMYHFANLKKTRITVVADDPGAISEKIEALYPFLDMTVDLRYEATSHFFNEHHPVPCDEISVCFIALDDDGKSVYFSRKLRQFLYLFGEKTQQQNRDVLNRYHDLSNALPPIKVLLPRNTAVMTIFSDVAEEMRRLHIELLHLDDEICNKRMIVDNRKSEDFIAKHIHYEWAKKEAERHQRPLQSLQAEWESLKDAQKDSNRLPARHLFIKLRYVEAGFMDGDGGEEIGLDQLSMEAWDRIARMEHHRWLAEKRINGFAYADKPTDKQAADFMKNELKVHWDLIGFDALNAETQAYDTFTFRMAPQIARLNQKRLVKLAPLQNN